jgi:hypothetical protein
VCQKETEYEYLATSTSLPFRRESVCVYHNACKIYVSTYSDVLVCVTYVMVLRARSVVSGARQKRVRTYVMFLSVLLM